MSKQTTCDSIKAKLVAFFTEQTEVTAAEDRCVVTLPLKTLDDRCQDVYVDQKLGDYVLVHDAGNSLAELFTQGIHPTDTHEQQFKKIARRYGATFNAGVFQLVCRPGDSVEQAILAIAQCAALAMFEVVNHQPLIEDEPLTARIGRTLVKWKPEYVDIRQKLRFKGIRAVHSFDFVSFARNRQNNVAIKILVPSGSGPLAQAERYGFLALDIEGQEYEQWQRLAVISKAELWSDPAIELVRNLSADTIMLNSDNEERIETVLPGMMTVLTEAA